MRAIIAALLLTLAAAGAAHGQDISADPTYGEFALITGFLPDPRELGMTAGGEVEVDVDGCDYGYVAEAPDANFTYKGSETSPLYIYVESDEDTMLLVNGPDGTWYCDDDGFGDLNPLISIPTAGNGIYNV